MKTGLSAGCVALFYTLPAESLILKILIPNSILNIQVLSTISQPLLSPCGPHGHKY